MNRLPYERRNLWLAFEKVNLLWNSTSLSAKNHFLTFFWTSKIGLNLLISKNQPCFWLFIFWRSLNDSWKDELAEHRNSCLCGTYWSLSLFFIHRDSLFKANTEIPSYEHAYYSGYYWRILQGKGQQVGCNKAKVLNWHDRNWQTPFLEICSYEYIVFAWLIILMISSW